jgi:hypothetical protein
MPKIEATREVQGKSASESYQACVSLIETIGYKLFKKRDLANLIICNEKLDGQKVNLSIMVPFGSPTTLTLNLSSDKMDEPALQVEVDRILDLLLSNM